MAGNALCVLNGKPWYTDLPEGAVFVGMEKEPNKGPKHGKLIHPWFNRPCYEKPLSKG